MAYEIEKKREGYYYLVYFTLDTENLEEITKEYLLHEDLIRFMTLSCDQVKETLEFKSIKLSS